MRQPVLFIGGPLDGERMMMPDSRAQYECDECPPMDPSAPPDEAIAEDLAIRRHVYRRVPLLPEYTVHIFAHDELSAAQAFGRLIDRYPAPERRR